jgi:hypothetical protein
MFKRTSLEREYCTHHPYAARHSNLAAAAWFVSATLVPIAANATPDCPDGTTLSLKYGLPALVSIVAAGIATGTYLWRRKTSFIARRVLPFVVGFIFLVVAVYVTGFLAMISPCVPK